MLNSFLIPKRERERERERENGYRKICIIAFLFALLSASCINGIFLLGPTAAKHLEMWLQRDSEFLVYGQILRKKHNLPGDFGLYWAYSNHTTEEGYAYLKEYETDTEWIKNFHRHKNIIRIPNNRYTVKVYKENNIIGFSNGDKFKIIKVQADNGDLQVFLAGNNKLSDHFNQPVGEISIYDAQEKVLPALYTQEYRSHFGLQGRIFNSIFKTASNFFSDLSIKEFLYLARLGCALLTAGVLLAICIFICKKYDYVMGASFYMVFLCSPYIAGFAANVYFVEFTWFLPVLAGLICSCTRNNIVISLCIFFIFLSFLIKCLCGYEFITTIMITTVSFILFDLFSALLEKNTKDIFHNLKLFIFSSLALLAAFAVAILIHAYIRGNGNILSGLESIYIQDVLRRTFGDPSMFNTSPKLIVQSLSASPLVVLAKYFYFTSPVFFGGIGGHFFPILYILPIIIFIYNIRFNKINYNHVFMYFVLFLAPTSWIILAKGFSYIHLTFNYTLFYFGFIQICVYIITKNIPAITAMTNCIFSFLFKVFEQRKSPSLG